MKFFGIDLAWTYKNETGICIIDEHGEVEQLESAIFSNEDIVEIIKAQSDEALTIAIDAPLIVNNESGGRRAESELMRSRINGHRLFAFNSSRGYLTRTFGEIRGETLIEAIKKAMPEIEVGFSWTDSNIVETFPTGICSGLFPDMFPIRYKKKRRLSFAQSCSEMDRLMDRFRLIEKTGEISGLMLKLDKGDLPYTRKRHKHIEDKVDAFLCAYGMYTIHRNTSYGQSFGTVDDGFILIPVKYL
ncbi:DUF429 domain-containing protein [Salinicoccus sp. ID82-1]|uniref:DUF429 domain-containing protein n=1 Tax=Salinicoccus sp. ID82-1 TaxID=2820269 RepID=UPI001F1FE497|nr:DUF429 domain-containing protein [Salinicoccus sp. ID82-1]MCG1008964.1 DUF429 domain-containing protein [Salinicoccus sp. ID82-1]